MVRYALRTHPLARRKKLLESSRIDVVLDVGANKGQYAQELRATGYKGRIVSFEPLSSAYRQLSENAKGDDKWDTMNFALGATNGTTEINVSANSVSSSILEMLPSHLKAAPSSKYVAKEKIAIKTLDSNFHDFCSESNNVLLKIDTQGFEQYVLEGAEEFLQFVEIIEIEMSLVPLYQGNVLFFDMCDILYRKGFCIFSIEPGFSDNKTGQLLEVDGIFYRTQ